MLFLAVLLFWIPHVWSTCDCVVSSLPNIFIPDGVGISRTATMFVPDLGVVQDVKSWTKGVHTWIGDLRMQIVNPDSSVAVTVFNQFCNSGPQNWDFGTAAVGSGPVDSVCPTIYPEATRYRTVPEMSQFAAHPSVGLWSFVITDLQSRDDGTIQAWNLTIRGDVASCPVECGGVPITVGQPCPYGVCQNGIYNNAQCNFAGNAPDGTPCSTDGTCQSGVCITAPACGATVATVMNGGNAVSGAGVFVFEWNCARQRDTITLAEVSAHCVQVLTGTTGSNGQVSLMIPPGEHLVISASLKLWGSGVVEPTVNTTSGCAPARYVQLNVS